MLAIIERLWITHWSQEYYSNPIHHKSVILVMSIRNGWFFTQIIHQNFTYS